MLDLVAKKLFLTKGKGIHTDRLTSFEYAQGMLELQEQILY